MFDAYKTGIFTLFNLLILFFSSLVIGLPEEKPSIISFLQHFEAGACLTIGWSSGRVQYYPIIYTDLSVSDQINTTLYSTFNTSPF